MRRAPARLVLAAAASTLVCFVGHVPARSAPPGPALVELSLDGGYAEDFTVFLHPKTIDVTKDVVVEVDGKEAYRGKPVPDVWAVLDTLDSCLDRTLTFDRRLSLAKP